MYFSRAFLLLLIRFVGTTVGWDWPTGILMIIIIMTSHTQKMFLSGSLHFGIKFYCSDEDESSVLCIFLERSYCCWYVLSYRGLGLTNRYFDDDNDESHPKNVFEWESSFWNKILLQWWGWIVKGEVPAAAAAADTFCRTSTVGFCSKGTRFRPLEPTGTWIPGGWAPTSNPSIFRAFSAQPKVSDCTSKNWFRAACSGR